MKTCTACESSLIKANFKIDLASSSTKIDGEFHLPFDRKTDCTALTNYLPDVIILAGNGAIEVKVGRVLAFEGWGVIVWTTPFVRRAPSINEIFFSGYRVPDFVKPADSLFDLIMQAKRSPVLTGHSSMLYDQLRTNAKGDQQIQNIKLHCLHPC